MTEPTLTDKLLLLQMRQAQKLGKVLYHEISKDRTFGDGFSSLMAAEELLQEAEKLVRESKPS